MAKLPEQLFCVKSTHGLEFLVSTAQGSSHSSEHPREEEHFVTSFGPKRYPSAGRIDCFPRCTSWPRRPPRARPSCRTAGPCRMANRQDCNVPRMSIRLRTMVLDRKESWRTRTSYEAASKRSSPQDQEHQLMPEAIWSMKPNVQSAADSSRTWPPSGLHSVLGSGYLFCRCRHVQDINILVLDVPRDINVCPWNRARRLSMCIQLITRTDNGV